jgi:hypothetical protein
MAAGADRVYLVLSCRGDRNEIQEEPLPGNVEIVASMATWFARTPSGMEWFDAYRVMENANVGLARAFWDGFDQCVLLMVNWYVPAEAWPALRRPVEAGWRWLYRKDQLGGQMFHASKRLPWIVDTAAGVRFSADGMEYLGEWHPWEAGDFSAHDGEAVVDLQLELSPQQLERKMNFMRCYHDLVPKRPATFEWEYYRRYYAEKYGRKARSEERPVVESAEGYVSHEVLGAL